jgi:SAM-dependent methyltransferase
MRADQATWAGRSSRMLDQEAAAGSSFGADVELERLAEAERFFGWIADELVPHLGHRVLEVGAGIGTVSLKLLERKPGVQITALEPDPKLHDELVRRTKRHPAVQTLNVTSGDLLQSDMHPTFDSVVYVNVLEHILDDAGELRTAHDLLVPGGTLAIFVPALPRLYGSLDYKSGHHRRYTAESLGRVVGDAGLDLVDVRYLDVLGIVPYFAMYRLLDVKSLGSVSSTGYDRVIVPLSRAVQRLVPHPPVGKNLLAIARRPHEPGESEPRGPALRLAR